MSPVKHKYTIRKHHYRKNYNLLIDVIEQAEKANAFDMRQWITYWRTKAKKVHLPHRTVCNTIACIGGWADLLFTKGMPRMHCNAEKIPSAQEYLGMGPYDEGEAQYPTPWYWLTMGQNYSGRQDEEPGDPLFLEGTFKCSSEDGYRVAIGRLKFLRDNPKERTRRVFI